ncbi:acetyl-CoA C-acyltransferase [Pueribacillus theae]|uniref:acetyl-CoA C-acyltransferase n=1 Tax=Pueribacillus theae TaxID=2171751 RepID=A0A2U1JZV7_9BACI|nr:acetyl-CoA C-acyltransferase [Pueribacillus theae]
MKKAVIISGVRTAIAKSHGQLKDVPEEEYASLVVKEAVERSGVNPEDVEDIIFGNTLSANANIGRYSALLAGLPISISGITLNRQCGSGLQAINYAAQGIQSGVGDLYIAGGVESMTRAPYILEKPSTAYSRIPPRFLELHAAPPDKGDAPMGITAENVAEEYNITREEQDKFALMSQQRAANALEKGYYKEEIVPVKITDKKGNVTIFDTDEHPRPQSTLEALSNLRPVFKKGGTVTAGNSSGINDGAAALVLASAEKAAEFGIQPLVSIKSQAVAGVRPEIMGIGPVDAVRKALKRANLQVEDIDLIELNEAFASQSVAVVNELGLDIEKVNVNGGAISLGHPIGATGAILMVKLIHEMKRRNSRYGLVTMCIGGGMGIATIVENEQL